MNFHLKIACLTLSLCASNMMLTSDRKSSSSSSLRKLLERTTALLWAEKKTNLTLQLKLAEAQAENQKLQEQLKKSKNALLVQIAEKQQQESCAQCTQPRCRFCTTHVSTWFKPNTI